MALKRHQLKATSGSSKTSREGKNRKQQQGKAACAEELAQRGRPERAAPEELAAKLSHDALAGDLVSLKLLNKMEDRNKSTKPAAKKRRGLTYAQQLALDPPWLGDPDAFLTPEEEPPTNPEQ